jgi:hypothetical protein
MFNIIVGGSLRLRLRNTDGNGITGNYFGLGSAVPLLIYQESYLIQGARRTGLPLLKSSLQPEFESTPVR